MNYIYYNEFGKEVKKLIMPIAKGSSNIKIIIFSDLDNMASSPYKVSAAFKRADGLVAGDIALSNSVDKKTNPYNQVEMYYRELVIGNDLTELVGGLELSLKYVTTESIEVEPTVFYNEDTIRVQAMAVFNIYNAVSFITPPQNTQLINLKNYVDNQDALVLVDYDNKLALKADKADTYLKTEVYNKTETYNRTEVDGLNDLNAKLSTTYTILESDELLDRKANIVILQSITTQPATATTNQIYYNAYDKKILLYDGSDWGVDNVGANGILYMFNNVLYVYNTYDSLIKIGQKPTNFDSLIVDSLHNSGAATFDNEVGIRELTVSGATIFQSGLSTNGNKIVNVATGVDNTDAVNVKQLADVMAGDLANYYTKVQTYSQDEINTLIASNYKAKGNLAPGGLVAGLLIAANLGNVYNITGQFTTTTNFLEGPGIIHEAGENVAIVEYSAGVYKFDVLSSFVDLSNYVEKDDIKEDAVFQATSLDSLTSGQKSAIATQINDVLTSGEIDKEKFKNFILEITLTGNKYYYQCIQYFMINGIATLYFASSQTTGIIKLYVDTLTPANSTLTKNDSIPDISLNDNTATVGKYISQLEVDSVDLHKINITKADLPTIPTVTNDLTNTLKTNYDDAYTHSQQAHAPSNAEQNVQSNWTQTVDTEDDYIKNKPSIPTKTSDLTNDSGFINTAYTLPQASTNTRGGIRADTKQATDTVEVKIDVSSEKLYAPTYPTVPTKTSDLTDDIGFATETFVNNKVSAVYKPQGSVPFSSLVVGLLVAANSGFVYNITDAFTTNANFVEGAGKSHSAGTNVVIIENSGNYKFDVLSGTVDLTPYELLSNKVIAWSETTNDTRYASEKLVKDSLDELENTIQGVSDLSPYHYEGTFIANDTMQSILRPLEAGGGDDTFVVSKLKGAMFVCETDGAFTFSSQYTWSEEVGSRVDTIIYNFLPPYQDDSLLPSTNFKIKDVITIVNFQLGGVSPRTITLTMQVEKQLEAVDISGKEDISNKLKAANDWTATPSDDKYVSEAFAKDKLVAKDGTKVLSDKNYTEAEQTKVSKIITNADGTKYFADDGTYKTITIPTVTNDFTNAYKTRIDDTKYYTKELYTSVTWSGATSPYTLDVSITNLTINDLVVLRGSTKAIAETIFDTCGLTFTQSAGKITLSVTTKPTAALTLQVYVIKCGSGGVLT